MPPLAFARSVSDRLVKRNIKLSADLNAIVQPCVQAQSWACAYARLAQLRRCWGDPMAGHDPAARRAPVFPSQVSHNPPGRQTVGVAGAEELLLVGQQLAVQAQCLRRVPSLASRERDVATGGQGVGVTGAEDLLLVRSQLAVHAQRPGRVSAVAGPGRAVGTGGQGAGMAGAEGRFRAGPSGLLIRAMSFRGDPGSLGQCQLHHRAAGRGTRWRT